MGANQRGENAMAGKSISCPNLIAAYEQPIEVKQRFLETEHAKGLLASLPTNICNGLIEGYLAGKNLADIGASEVIRYFNDNSINIPELSEYPGTFTMLERMYGFDETLHIDNPIDCFFKASLPAFTSLSARFSTVNEQATTHINKILENQEKCLVLDLGSGPGRNCIQLVLDNPEFAKRVEFYCIDTDPSAIRYGIKLVKHHELTNIHFIEKSMATLHRMYRHSADYGLIIGVLCGLNEEERIALLKVVRPYFKPGARVVGAGLLDTMLTLDLFCTYILRETAGWILQYSPIGVIENSFNGAGYTYEGYFQEEPTKCYEIGIGLA